MPAKLVTFSGIDCAGKSTQIALLVRALRSQKRSVRQLWFRPGYSKELDVLRATVRRLRPALLPRDSHKTARERAFRKPLVSQAWLRMAQVDTLLQLGVKVRYWLAQGDVVVCDRWLGDALIDLELRFEGLSSARGSVARALDMLLPEPRVQFVLAISHAEMLRRMAIKREPFPDAPELRDRRFLAYERLARGAGYQRLDCERSVDSVHAQVMRQLVEV